MLTPSRCLCCFSSPILNGFSLLRLPCLSSLTERFWQFGLSHHNLISSLPPSQGCLWGFSLSSLLSCPTFCTTHTLCTLHTYVPREFVAPVNSSHPSCCLLPHTHPGQASHLPKHPGSLALWTCQYLPTVCGHSSFFFLRAHPRLPG